MKKTKRKWELRIDNHGFPVAITLDGEDFIHVVASELTGLNIHSFVELLNNGECPEIEIYDGYRE